MLQGWGENDRGVSYTFGPDCVTDFLQRHDLDLVCRAHQVRNDLGVCARAADVPGFPCWHAGAAACARTVSAAHAIGSVAVCGALDSCRNALPVQPMLAGLSCSLSVTAHGAALLQDHRAAAAWHAVARKWLVCMLWWLGAGSHCLKMQSVNGCWPFPDRCCYQHAHQQLARVSMCYIATPAGCGGGL